MYILIQLYQIRHQKILAISKDTLLQVNATVIAGLLILLTIQSSNQITEDFLTEKKLERKLEGLKSFVSQTDDKILAQKASERIVELTIQQIEFGEEASLQKLSPMNPMVFFLAAMTLFIASCIWEIHSSSKSSTPQQSTRLARWLSYIGFVILFVSTMYFLSIQIQSSY